MRSYCIFCRTGKEADIAHSIGQADPSLVALAPAKLIPEKRQGVWTNKEQILLPGYVFVYSEDEYTLPMRNLVHGIYKVLQYEIGLRELTGEDDIYAQWIYRHQGQIKPTKVFCEGDQIKIVSGPLADCEGKIIRMDKHKRRAWVAIQFDGQVRTVCLGIEFVENGA